MVENHESPHAEGGGLRSVRDLPDPSPRAYTRAEEQADPFSGEQGRQAPPPSRTQQLPRTRNQAEDDLSAERSASFGTQTDAPADTRTRSGMRTRGGAHSAGAHSGMRTRAGAGSAGAEAGRDEGRGASEGHPDGKLRPRRSRGLIVLVIIAAVLVCALAAVLATMLVTTKSSATRDIDQAIASIQDAENTVLAVDAAIDEEVTESTLSEIEALIDEAASAKETLLEAASLAEKGRDNNTSADGRAFAQHVVDSATARSEMLNYGKGLLRADTEAMRSALLVASAFDKAVVADSKMREAVGLASSVDTIQQSLEANQAAETLLTEALGLVKDAATAFPEADLSLLVNYFQAKKDSAALAIQSDQALISKDAAAASSLNEQYAAKDAEAVALAQQIPSDPLQLIYAAYEGLAQGLRVSYLDARIRAAEADYYIRDYLKVPTSSEEGSGESASSTEPTSSAESASAAGTGTTTGADGAAAEASATGNVES